MINPKPGRRLGLFGGTFDPVHIGHMVLAQEVRFELGLDAVVFMVAGDPWQKSELHAVTNAETRLAAVQAAVGDEAGLDVSRLEVDRRGPTYTADTLRALHDASPDDEWFLILGTDAAARLPTWRDPEAVRDRATVVGGQRPGTPSVTLPAGWRVQSVAIPALDVSSTELRERLRAGRPVRHLVPEAALEVITRGWGNLGS